MRSIFATILFGILVLCACSFPISPPQPIPVATTQAPPISIPTTAVPSDQGQCGYQWANQDLPELSSSFHASIQALQPGAQARAYAFGENCVRPDGTVASFSAMETDFDVSLQVSDLTNEDELGGWIVRIMQIIEAIPPEQVTGPRPGRVTITFQKASDQKVINFYIDKYKALTPGLSNTEIYQALQTPQ
jgi:hypothetical protein